MIAPRLHTRLASGLSLLFLIPLLSACGEKAPSVLAPDAIAFDKVNSSGRTRYVSPTGADVHRCSESACLTINYAISQADAGDVISVGPGTYHESVNVTKRLTLVGHNATIDAAGQSAPPNGVVISGAGAAGSQLTGFTITNAGLEGVFVLQTTRITIDNNIVINNDTYGPFNPACVNQPDDCGEAVHLQTVTNSIVRNNLVRDNIGGILLTDENGPTSGNMISDNTVLNNTLDCGITLASHWFNPVAAAGPDVAGVYRNTGSAQHLQRQRCGRASACSPGLPAPQRGATKSPATRR